MEQCILDPYIKRRKKNSHKNMFYGLNQNIYRFIYLINSILSYIFITYNDI